MFCGRRSRAAYSLFGEQQAHREEVTPNSICYSATIDAWENGGQWQLKLSPYLSSCRAKVKVTLGRVSYGLALLHYNDKHHCPT